MKIRKPTIQRFALLAATGLALVACTPVPVANSSFESGTSSWAAMGGGAITAPTDARANNGTHVLLLSPPAGFFSYGVQQSASVRLPDIQYGFGVWVGLNHSTTGTVQPITLELLYAPTANTQFPSACTSSFTPTKTGTLTQAMLTGCNVPANSYVAVALMATPTTTSPPAYIIDTVQLMDSSPGK